MRFGRLVLSILLVLSFALVVTTWNPIQADSTPSALVQLEPSQLTLTLGESVNFTLRVLPVSHSIPLAQDVELDVSGLPPAWTVGTFGFIEQRALMSTTPVLLNEIALNATYIWQLGTVASTPPGSYQITFNMTLFSQPIGLGVLTVDAKQGAAPINPGNELTVSIQPSSAVIPFAGAHRFNVTVNVQKPTNVTISTSTPDCCTNLLSPPPTSYTATMYLRSGVATPTNPFRTLLFVDVTGIQNQLLCMENCRVIVTAKDAQGHSASATLLFNVVDQAVTAPQPVTTSSIPNPLQPGQNLTPPAPLIQYGWTVVPALCYVMSFSTVYVLARSHRRRPVHWLVIVLVAVIAVTLLLAFAPQLGLPYPSVK